MPLTFTVIFEAKPGKEKELQNLLTSLIAPTHKETGCIQYDLHRDQNNPKRFFFYETWASHSALDAHHHSEHIQTFRGKVADMLAKPREHVDWEKI